MKEKLDTNKLIELLSKLKEKRCDKDCHNCPFSIYDDGWGDVCAINQVIENL